MTRPTWLALPLALLACSPSGGSGEDPGGEGGSLCVDTRDQVLALLAEASGSGPGLTRDGSRPKLGNGQLQAQITGVSSGTLDLTTVAGKMTFDFTGALPAGVEAGAAVVYQRDGWDYVESGDLTLAVYWAPTATAPPVPRIVENGTEKPAFTTLEIALACVADADCGPLSIQSVLVDGDAIFPGRALAVNGWTVANRGVATAGDRCPAPAVALITAWRKAPAE